MNDNYHPVSCSLHSELELAAMHRTKLDITTTDGRYSGHISDIVVKNSAEFLLLEDGSGETHEIRLDSIRSFTANK